MQVVGELAFGSIVHELESTRTVTLRNTGTVDGPFKCSFDRSSPLRIKTTPEEGVVPAGGALELVMTLTPNELGGYATPLEVCSRSISRRHYFHCQFSPFEMLRAKGSQERSVSSPCLDHAWTALCCQRRRSSPKVGKLRTDCEEKQVGCVTCGLHLRGVAAPWSWAMHVAVGEQSQRD